MLKGQRETTDVPDVQADMCTYLTQNKQTQTS